MLREEFVLADLLSSFQTCDCEFWSENLPNPGIEPRSRALQVDSLLSESPGKPKILGNRATNTQTKGKMEKSMY